MINVIDSEIFKLDEKNITIEEKYIGNFDNKLLLVNNFFKYPQKVKEYALSCKYIKPQIGTNPGFVHQYNFNPYDFLDFCTYLRANYFNNYTSPKEDYTFTFQAYKNVPKILPHIDSVEYAGLCCLNDEDEIKENISGTSFYRYKSGEEYTFRNSYRNEILKSSRLKDWNVYHTQYHKFNQFIFYESGLFHSAYWNKINWNHDTPRLTFNSFTW
jgi:hypothetical protein